MSDISDPSGARRGDRKRTKAVIDAAYAAGRITAADRALRIERVDAAATKGDLAGLTSGLEAPVAPPRQQHYRPPAPPTGHPQPPAAAGAALPPQQPPAPGPQPMATTSIAGSQAAASARRMRRGIGCLIAVIGVSVLLPCIIGIVTFLVSLGTSSFELSSDSTDLDTTAGWSSLLSDLRSENGTTVVDRVIFEESSATVLTRTSTGSTEQAQWANGSFISSTTRPTVAPPAQVVDLSAHVSVLTDVRDRAVERLGVSDPQTVRADVVAAGITVTVTSETGQVQTARYTLDGTES